MKHSCAVLTALLAITCGSSAADGPVPPPVAEQPVQGVLSAVSYPSIQAALDANPGRMVYVPSGDHVIVSQNVVINSFIGMKAMHGSRNVLITGNC